MRTIPDFLKPENRKQPDPETLEMQSIIRRYEDEIGGMLITEPSSLTTQEWIAALNECLEKHMTIWELFDEKYDADADY